MSIVAVAALAQDVDLVLEAVDLPAEARLDTRLRRKQVWTCQTHGGKDEVKSKGRAGYEESQFLYEQC